MLVDGSLAIKRKASLIIPRYFAVSMIEREMINSQRNFHTKRI